MRVLWFCNNPGLATEYLSDKKINGTGGWIISLNRVVEKVVELHVAFHYPYKKDTFQYSNTTYHPVYTGNIYLSILKNKISSRVIDDEFLNQYLELINEIRPDIIHIHGTENDYGCILGKTTIPIVTSIQGNLTVITHKYLESIESKYLYHPYATGTSFLQRFLSLNSYINDYKKMVNMASIEKKYTKRRKYYIGRTEWDKSVIAIQSPQSVYYHTDEILRTPFYENKWVQRAGDDTFIIHSTLSGSFIKGIDTIFYAIYLLSHITTKTFIWQVAGISQGSPILKIIKKKLGSCYPSEDRICLLGSLSADELAEKMLKADLFVMSSIIENSSNSLCEAMLLGMPCLATFAGGTSSIIKDGQNGVLIPSNDPWAMAGRILHFSEDCDFLRFLAKNAYADAHNRHNKDNVLKQLLYSYNEIISKEQK